MKFTRVLWFLCFFIVLCWFYFIYITPITHKKNEIIVPNIVNMNEEEAVEVLKTKKIKYNLTYLDGKDNRVSYTMPKAGTKIYNDYKIDVFVYHLASKYYPNLVGLVFDEAKDIIDTFEDNNISYTIDYVIRNDYPKGVILNQSKDENDLMLEGDSIHFTISIWDDFIVMPKLIGYNVEEAINLLDDYNIKYHLIYTFSAIDEDIILSQSVAEGIIIKKGNEYPIELYVSKGLTS